MGIALRKGENMPILASVAEIRCRWSSFGDVDADLSALLLRGRQVRTDDDFIFYNQAESVDGSVKYLGKRHAGDGFEDRIAINLADVAAAADIDAIAVVLSVDSGHRLVELGAVTATILDAGGTSLATFTMIDLTVETAAVAFAIYRRGGWKGYLLDDAGLGFDVLELDPHARWVFGGVAIALLVSALVSAASYRLLKPRCDDGEPADGAVGVVADEEEGDGAGEFAGAPVRSPPRARIN